MSSHSTAREPLPRPVPAPLFLFQKCIFPLKSYILGPCLVNGVSSRCVHGCRHLHVQSIHLRGPQVPAAEPFTQLPMGTSPSSFQPPPDTTGSFQAPALLEHMASGGSLKPPVWLQHQTQARGPGCPQHREEQGAEAAWAPLPSPAGSLRGGARSLFY